ncbi:MAG: hypothetical protein H8E44_45990 [Planctomycetes bacterium]|nr:hypothetical protein [Planctomycetota bacterium]MBL7041963.1 hypothetical protein [Pirellulaceae bacterium]
MNDQSQQPNQDSRDPEDAILPGLGFVAGFLIGVVLWAFVEDWLTLSPVGLWVAQGSLFAGCVLIASMVDGLIRPRDWPWRYRIRKTVFLAVAVMILWGIAAIGHAIAGKTAAAIGWLVAFLVLLAVEWTLRKRRWA